MSDFLSTQALIGSTWLYHKIDMTNVYIPASLVVNSTGELSYKLDSGVSEMYILDNPNSIAPTITVDPNTEGPQSGKVRLVLTKYNSVHRVKFLFANPDTRGIPLSFYMVQKTFMLSEPTSSTLTVWTQSTTEPIRVRLDGSRTLEAELIWMPLGNNKYKMQVVHKYVYGDGSDTDDVTLSEELYNLNGFTDEDPSEIGFTREIPL